MLCILKVTPETDTLFELMLYTFVRIDAILFHSIIVNCSTTGDAEGKRSKSFTKSTL